MTEYSVSGGTSTWAHTNAYASGALLATYNGTDTYFALNDWLGTKRAEASAGGCYSTFTSMPYGDGLTPSGNCIDATEHHFTGKERDTESGDDYFEARYYNSSMGRFLSPDPYNIIFEMMKGRDRTEQMQILTQYLSHPQSLNKYAYVVNNPLTMTDPDGLREANDQDRKAFDQLNQAFINAAGDSALQSALAGAAVALQNAIAAVPDGQADPASIGAVEWAIGQIGNSAWGKGGSINNGIGVPLGPGANKCNLFVASAYALGTGVGFGGNGYPFGKYSWTRSEINVPGANESASSDDLPHLPIANSASFGSIAAFSVGGSLPFLTHGHAALSIGGGALVYAGHDAGKVRTEQYVQSHEYGQPQARYRDYKP